MFLVPNNPRKKKLSLPHVNTRWSHSDAKSYGSNLKLGCDPWINKLLVTCMKVNHNITQTEKKFE